MSEKAEGVSVGCKNCGEVVVRMNNFTGTICNNCGAIIAPTRLHPMAENNMVRKNALIQAVRSMLFGKKENNAN